MSQFPPSPYDSYREPKAILEHTYNGNPTEGSITVQGLGAALNTLREYVGLGQLDSSRPEGRLDNAEHVEAALMPASFIQLVEDLDIHKIAQPQPERALPDPLSHYSFVALVDPQAKGPSNVPLLSEYSLPAMGNGRPFSNQRVPFLDSGRALGLVYGDKICQVASACVDFSDRLKIVQMQGTVKFATSKARYRGGLYDGLDRRATLVHAWVQIARHAGTNVLTLQSARNTIFPPAQRDTEQWKRYETNYDGLAERLGFLQSKSRPYDWHLYLD